MGRQARQEADNMEKILADLNEIIINIRRYVVLQRQSLRRGGITVEGQSTEISGPGQIHTCIRPDKRIHHGAGRPADGNRHADQ